jgi:hypothetical protein
MNLSLPQQNREKSHGTAVALPKARLEFRLTSRLEENNMTARHLARFAFSGFLALGVSGAVIGASRVRIRVPVKLSSGRVSIAGTSNIHEYTVDYERPRRSLELADGVVFGPNFWDEIIRPGAIESFEVAIAAVRCRRLARESTRTCTRRSRSPNFQLSRSV